VSTPSDPFSTPSTPSAWESAPALDASASYGPPPTAYGASAPAPVAHAGPPATSNQAVIALCCAIGSYVLLPFIAAIIALALVPGARDEIAGSGGRLSGEGLLTATKVLAWINIALCVLAVLAVVAVFALFAQTGFS
jgi:hypothetical protein